jgi:hypothetical protein
MALVKDIKVGDFIGHYGKWFPVTLVKKTVEGVEISVKEDGAYSVRVENEKTNLPVRGE